MVSQILPRTDQNKFPFEKQFGTNKFSIDIAGKVDFKEPVLFRNFLEISEALKVGGEMIALPLPLVIYANDVQSLVPKVGKAYFRKREKSAFS